jgi:hypothetical protein
MNGRKGEKEKTGKGEEKRGFDLASSPFRHCTFSPL